MLCTPFISHLARRHKETILHLEHAKLKQTECLDNNSLDYTSWLLPPWTLQLLFCAAYAMTLSSFVAYELLALPCLVRSSLSGHSCMIVSNQSDHIYHFTFQYEESDARSSHVRPRDISRQTVYGRLSFVETGEDNMPYL